MIGKDLLADLDAIAAEPEIRAALDEHRVHSYNDLFATIKQDELDESLRPAILALVEHIAYALDRRRTIPLLIRFLTINDPHLRAHVAELLGIRNGRRAVIPLISLLRDKSENLRVRDEAARALCFLDDQRAMPVLRAAILNPDEHPIIRSDILEVMPSTAETVEDCITLLRDRSSDVRFWAAYKLSQEFGDIDPAFHALDQAAAYDHELPQGWGWHIDREALYALEMLNLRRLGYPDAALGKRSWRDMRFISPVPEFFRFFKAYRKMVDFGRYETINAPESNFKVDVDWLRQQIEQRWPDTIFDSRNPHPIAYILNWTLEIDGEPLLGALHRDESLLVLSGAWQAILEFAAWYRNLFSPEIPLYLYSWAEKGFLLQYDMSLADIDKADAAASY